MFEELVKFIEPRAEEITQKAEDGCPLAKELIQAYQLVAQLPTPNICLDYRLKRAYITYRAKD